MNTDFNAWELLEALELAVKTDTIADVVPEDLETVAHNTLWDPDSPEELVLLKQIPNRAATQVEHEFALIEKYAHGRGNGRFSEDSLPSTGKFTPGRRKVYIRLVGRIAPTFILAQREKMIDVLGTNSPAAANEEANRRDLLKIKERNMYFERTDWHRDGTSSLRTKSIFEQIQEGTDGTLGEGYGGQSHIIDMQGDPLTLSTIRERIANAVKLFGVFNNLHMDSHTRADFEKTLDGAGRLAFPQPWTPLVMGQHVSGIQSNGRQVFFHTTNSLDPEWSHPYYSGDDLEDGAPTTKPAVSVATSSSSAAKFDSASAGQLYWVVTEWYNEREGLGTRVPSSGYTTVAVGQKATLTIQAGNPLAHTFRIYRGDDSGGGTAEEAQFIFEAAHTAAGAAQDVDDLNEWRHGHAVAFGLRIVSSSQRMLSSGRDDSYDRAWKRRARFLHQGDDMRQNTVTAVHLGPAMGVMELAKTLPFAKRPLMFSACAVQVRNPRQNIVFKNIGRL